MDWTFPLWKEGELCVCLLLTHTGLVLIPWAYASFHLNSATICQNTHLSNIYTVHYLPLCLYAGGAFCFQAVQQCTCPSLVDAISHQLFKGNTSNLPQTLKIDQMRFCRSDQNFTCGRNVVWILVCTHQRHIAFLIRVLCHVIYNSFCTTILRVWVTLTPYRWKLAWL